MTSDAESGKQYDFSEKFKGKSTGELLAGIAPDQLRLLRQWLGQQGSTPEDPPHPFPALWLAPQEESRLADSLEDKDLDKLHDVMRGAHGVPRNTDEIETTLFGELIGLLRNASIALPSSIKTPYGQLVVIDRRRAGEIAPQISDFLRNATDETLADPEAHFMLLYNGETELVRQGINYLRKAVEMPSEYSCVVLVLR